MDERSDFSWRAYERGLPRHQRVVLRLWNWRQFHPQHRAAWPATLRMHSTLKALDKASLVE